MTYFLIKFTEPMLHYYIHAEIIASTISNLPAKLYKIKRSWTEFKVDFEQIRNPFVITTPYVSS